jgi:prephenate dehydrogenase
MAGAETTGPLAARANLFEGATWYLCCEGEPPAPLAEVVTALGALPRTCEPAAHDRMVAELSHLPQALAWLLAAGWRATGLTGAEGGPVAREFARLARSSPQLWDEILTANREALAPAVRRLGVRALELATALEATGADEAGRTVKEWLT